MPTQLSSSNPGPFEVPQRKTSCDPGLSAKEGPTVERATADASRASLFREVNDRIAELTQQFDGDSGGLFICECSNSACAETVEITLPEYVATRARSDRFIVLAGHQHPERERVVDGNGRFLVVEKIDAAGKATCERDPCAR